MPHPLRSIALPRGKASCLTGSWQVATAWRNRASRDFLGAYIEAVQGTPIYPADSQAAESLLELFLLQKGFYEIAYEAANRPHWLSIPLRNVIDLLTGTRAYQT